jgi:pimeloyl-ACP methyl ester carboxylesterase
MPHVTTPDGVKLYYEETGSGTPIIFVHEFAGDYRSWEAQVRYFSRRFRCIAYSARGYLPSDVPPNVDSYSQEHARDDVLAVMDGLGIKKAHVVGLSMGGFATLHFGLKYPERALSLSVCGCGSGAHPDRHEAFKEDSENNARFILKEGMKRFSETYGLSATRVQLQNKNPRGFADFQRYLGEHDATGSAYTMRGYQSRRPSLYTLMEQLKTIEVPMLIATGDEDEACIEPSVMLKRLISSASLTVFPASGHLINLEEPDLFNATIDSFLDLVESGRWQPRDTRSKSAVLARDLTR